MKKSILIIVFVSLFSLVSSYSQTETNNYSSDSEVFNSQQNELNLLSGLSFISQVNPEESVNSFDYNAPNSVIISQIGFNNYINSETKSDFSTIELLQNGDSNSIDLLISAPTISHNIIQDGNNNSVKDAIYYSNQEVGLQLIQKGNNLSLNRIGVNSLTNKLQLSQEGSFKTITIISN